MYPSRFRYEAPRSLDEAISTLRDGGDYAKVLAGGQSLVPMMKLRFASPELVVDINNVPGLDYHRAEPDGTLRVGALCRHAVLERVLHRLRLVGHVLRGLGLHGGEGVFRGLHRLLGRPLVARAPGERQPDQHDEHPHHRAACHRSPLLTGCEAAVRP